MSEKQVNQMPLELDRQGSAASAQRQFSSDEPQGQTENDRTDQRNSDAVAVHGNVKGSDGDENKVSAMPGSRVVSTGTVGVIKDPSGRISISQEAWATMTPKERAAAALEVRAVRAKQAGRLAIVPKQNDAVTSGASRSPVTLRNAIPAVKAPVREAWPELFEHDKVFATMRESRRRRFFIRLAAFVGAPTLLAAIYLFLLATPRYVSEFEMTYQTYQNTQSLASGLVQSVLGSSSAGVDFGSILSEYAQSATMLHKLDDKLHVRDYYSSDSVDYAARLSANASDEKFLQYYRSHIIDVSVGMGGYITVDVHAFDPKFAQALATAIVQGCDEMMDQMTSRARLDEMKFAEEEVARQEGRVRDAQLAQTKFQNLHGDLNPTNTATQFGQIVGTLEGQLAQAKTSLANTLSYAGPDSPQARQLNNQIAALETQLKEQRNRLTGGDSTYSQILEEYARIQLEQQFAQSAYLSAQQGMTVARADAARKQSYLVDFISPSLPDGPSHSFYTTFLAAAFLGSLLLYAIGSLVGGAFRDQAGL